MTHNYPTLLPAAFAAPVIGAAAARSSSPPAVTLGAWRYPSVPRSRWRVALALLVSAGLHAGVLLSVRSHPPAAVRHDTEHLISISIPIPDLKDLEEPEPVIDDTAPKPDIGDYAPTLADIPTIPMPTDFVQELNFASLLPRPDLTDAKVFIIPSNIIRSGKLAEGLGNIFNLADLDRIPEATVQPAPIFPPALRREVSYARIVVEFIVDTEGRVHNPVVVEATFPGFEDSATTGVSRWRFRPGMRSGRKVNTRMSVPIIFRLAENS